LIITALLTDLIGLDVCPRHHLLDDEEYPENIQELKPEMRPRCGG
jgi:hypothetical protein